MGRERTGTLPLAFPQGSTAAQLSTRSLAVDSTELLAAQVSRKGGDSQQIQAVSAGSCTKDSPSKQVLMPVHRIRELAGASLVTIDMGSRGSLMNSARS